MPFENPQAEAAPTRRSSRLRSATSETPATHLDAATPAPSRHDSPVPLSRRAARQRGGAESVVASVVEAQSLIAAAAVADVVADESSREDAPARAEVASEPVASSARPASGRTGSARRASAAPSPADAAPTPAAAEEDAFEKAARALGLAPVVESSVSPEPAPEAPLSDEVAEPGHVAARRPRLRRLVTVGATVGVMSVAGLLAVSMSLPTGAVAVAQGTQAGTTMSLVTASSEAVAQAGDADEEIQAYVASSDLQPEALEHAEDFSTVSLLDIAAEQGIKYSGEVFTNDPEAAIQWPFMVGVGMTWGYGMRDGRLHAGIDFVPGNGAPIQAIADGVVRKATEDGGGYGVTVYVDHIIDGKVITSHYSHMQHGSLRVKTGDKVEVGDVVGLTGNTGRSYGAHLHFELIVNGSTIDPMPWMNENAGRDSLG